MKKLYDKKITAKVLLWALILLFMSSVAYGSGKNYTLAFFVPHDKNPWWDKAADIMQAACDDLNMKLKVYRAKGNREVMKKQIEDASTGPSKVDGLLFQSFKQAGESFFKIAEKNKVPAFLFNAGVNHKRTGIPREKYKYWIGEMLPDDQGAGYDLANALIDEAKKAGKVRKDGKVHMVAIEGNIADGASIERVKGLKKAVALRSDVVLKRIVPGNWAFKIAKDKFGRLYKKYKTVSVAWAANDPMALGIVSASKKMNLKIKKDIFVGGIDWNEPALKSVQNGEMSLTIGGHFLETAWATVLLYDYFHGKDFAQESLMMKSKMNILNKTNIDAYLNKLGKGDWQKVDFSKFSKVRNPKLKKYNFGLDEILKQF